MDFDGAPGRAEHRYDGRWKETEAEMTSDEDEEAVVEMMTEVGRRSMQGITVALAQAHLQHHTHAHCKMD